MCLHYENSSLRSILFYTLKQHADYKSLIAKTFDGSTLKMKGVSDIDISVIKRKNVSCCVSIGRAL